MASVLDKLSLLFLLVISVASEPEKLVKKDVAVTDYVGPMTKNILNSLKDVEILHIKSSNITDYPSHVFSLLPNLRKIEVQRSHFNIMDRNIYKDANKLEEIYFAHNSVPELPLSLLRHTTFRKIVIQDQPQVKTIPKDFANETHNLHFFECSNCKIESIEEGAFNNLDKLEHLDLRKNSIKEFPKEVLAPLKNLRKLHLQDNLIQKFTIGDIQGLKNVETIDLSSNPLVELNLLDAPTVAPNLKIVDVRNTNVTEAQIDEMVSKTTILFVSRRFD